MVISTKQVLGWIADAIRFRLPGEISDERVKQIASLTYETFMRECDQYSGQWMLYVDLFLAGYELNGGVIVNPWTTHTLTADGERTF